MYMCVIWSNVKNMYTKSVNIMFIYLFFLKENYKIEEFNFWPKVKRITLRENLIFSNMKKWGFSCNCFGNRVVENNWPMNIKNQVLIYLKMIN